jgi:DNA/RNA endonuclease YhcR with UshA esterase domain
MSIRPAILLTSIAFLLAALPVSAHHSFAAQYDRQKSVTLKGKVTKVEWANPHVYFYIDVTDESGTLATWAVENGPPTSLFREGWRKDTLKPGDLVTVEGFRAKDGSNTANARSVVLSDGRKVFAGSSSDGAPSTNGKQ